MMQQNCSEEIEYFYLNKNVIFVVNKANFVQHKNL